MLEQPQKDRLELTHLTWEHEAPPHPFCLEHQLCPLCLLENLLQDRDCCQRHPGGLPPPNIWLWAFGPSAPPLLRVGVGLSGLVSGGHRLYVLSHGYAGDTVPLLSPSCAGMCFIETPLVGSSCLGSSPNFVRCDFDLQELLTDLITPESIALLPH